MIEGADLNTVCGLSLTSSGMGWVLVEGHAADGAILDHGEFSVRSGGGARAVEMSEQVAAAVMGAEATATAADARLHVIGVTWSDEAAAGAALLVEQLTAAGFHNVVSVRWVEAAETLAQGLVSVVGYRKTTVCVLEHESATVVSIDTCADESRTAVKQVAGGADELFRWMTRMFARDGWRPEGVVVVGSDPDLAAFSSELDDALPVPVFAQSGSELALARGAALASAQDAGLHQTALRGPAGRSRRAAQTPSYAGALTALVAASVTLVGSLSLAVGLRMTPDQPGAAHDAQASSRLVHVLPAPRAAEVPIAPPAVAPPPPAKPQPAAPAPAAAQPVAPSPEQEPTISSGSAAAVPDQPAAVPPAAAPAAPPPPAPEEPPPDPHPLLTKVLDLIHGHPQDPPPPDPPPPPSP